MDEIGLLAERVSAAGSDADLQSHFDRTHSGRPARGDGAPPRCPTFDQGRRAVSIPRGNTTPCARTDHFRHQVRHGGPSGPPGSVKARHPADQRWIGAGSRQVEPSSSPAPRRRLPTCLKEKAAMVPLVSSSARSPSPTPVASVSAPWWPRVARRFPSDAAVGRRAPRHDPKPRRCGRLRDRLQLAPPRLPGSVRRWCQGGGGCGVRAW